MLPGSNNDLEIAVHHIPPLSQATVLSLEGMRAAGVQAEKAELVALRESRCISG
jgi:hypothetical protein